MQDRDFKGVFIPKEIWLSTELSLLEKCLFTEIDSLDNEDGCYASNKYLSEFCNCSEKTITRAIKHLEELNMIIVNNFDGRNRVIKVYRQNVQAAWTKCPPSNIDNIYTNNTNITSNTITNNTSILGVSCENNHKDNDFLGSANKPKQNMYDKCIALIVDLSPNKRLYEKLVYFLNQLLNNARESGKTLYTNNFKGKLNSLKQFPQSQWEDIVQQSIDNGWSNFYELKNKQSFDGLSHNATYTQEELEEQAEWVKEMETDGKQVKF